MKASVADGRRIDFSVVNFEDDLIAYMWKMDAAGSWRPLQFFDANTRALAKVLHELLLVRHLHTHFTPR